MEYVANVRLGLLAADVWVAPTAAFRDQIHSLYAPPTRGRVIHNGSDAAFEPVPKEPFILCAGRLWDEAKNVSALGVVARELPWPIRVAGSQQMDAAANAPGLGIDMLGELPRRELLALMARAGIYVAPAVYEPFGLAVLEAAGAGCALVLSDLPTFRELWSDAALFVDPRDENQLRATLQHLCADFELRRWLQQVAQRRAGRYSLEQMGEAYSDAYASLMADEVTSQQTPISFPQPEARA